MKSWVMKPTLHYNNDAYDKLHPTRQCVLDRMVGAHIAGCGQSTYDRKTDQLAIWLPSDPEELRRHVMPLCEPRRVERVTKAVEELAKGGWLWVDGHKLWICTTHEQRRAVLRGDADVWLMSGQSAGHRPDIGQEPTKVPSAAAQQQVDGHPDENADESAVCVVSGQSAGHRPVIGRTSAGHRPDIGRPSAGHRPANRPDIGRIGVNDSSQLQIQEREEKGERRKEKGEPLTSSNCDSLSTEPEPANSDPRLAYLDHVPSEWRDTITFGLDSLRSKGGQWVHEGLSPDSARLLAMQCARHRQAKPSFEPIDSIGGFFAYQATNARAKPQMDVGKRLMDWVRQDFERFKQPEEAPKRRKAIRLKDEPMRYD